MSSRNLNAGTKRRCKSWQTCSPSLRAKSTSGIGTVVNPTPTTTLSCAMHLSEQRSNSFLLSEEEIVKMLHCSKYRSTCDWNHIGGWRTCDSKSPRFLVKVRSEHDFSTATSDFNFSYHFYFKALIYLCN